MIYGLAIARLQVGRLQHPRAGHRGAALGRAVRRRAGRQLRDRHQDGLPRPDAVPEPGGFHNKYEDIQLSVFTSYDSNGDGVNDAFFGDFTNAGSGHGARRGSRIPVAADAALADQRQPGVAGREVRRVHLHRRQHRRRAGVHQRARILRRAERGVPHAAVERRQSLRARGLRLPERRGRRRPRSSAPARCRSRRTATAWSTPA